MSPGPHWCGFPRFVSRSPHAVVQRSKPTRRRLRFRLRSQTGPHPHGSPAPPTLARARLTRAGAALGLAAVYVAASGIHALVVNTDVTRFDQDLYLVEARTLRLSSFAHLTNRAQMPAYAYALAAIDSPDLARDEMFARAKWCNIGLSAALLVAIHLVVSRLLPRREARFYTLLAAFTVFVFRAGYVQAELLFYTLSFFAYLALVRVWRRPAVLPAAGAGILAALAHLTKGTLLPGFVGFVLLFAARTLLRVKAVASLAQRFGASREKPRRCGSEAWCTAALIVGFFVPIWPYLSSSKTAFGSYFFNLNSSYALFCDSWEDFLARQSALGPWDRWHNLHDPRVPSLSSYLAHHGPLAIAAREVRGLAEVLGNGIVSSYGYAEFVAVLAAFAVCARPASASLSAGPTATRRDGFALPILAGYLLLFGFYGPVMAASRFLLTLYLPVTFSLLEPLAGQDRKLARCGRFTMSYGTVFRLLAASLMLHTLFRLPTTIWRLPAGG